MSVNSISQLISSLAAREPVGESHGAEVVDKKVGMYRIAIFKIRPEPDSTGYQTNYLAETGTGYLDTCCIIANFLVYFVVQIKNVLFSVFVFSFVCSHTA